ncbi:MAG: ABC transporter ATP-binding protein, partial [Candidatus Heimdallarchaeaceae archaeon]
MSHGPSGSRRRTRRGGPMGIGLGKEKASDFTGTMKKLIRYLGRYKVVILIALLIAIASTAATIFGPRILGNATTKLFEGLIAAVRGTGEVDFDAIQKLLYLALALYISAALL